MNDRPPKTTRYASLRATRRVLARSAPVARAGLAMAGLAWFLDLVRPLAADVQLTYGERVVAGIVALVVLGGFGLAAWLVGNLLRASAELVDVLVDQAEAVERAADLIELQISPTLARLAVALERSMASSQTAAGGDGQILAVEGVRRAIEARRWSQAERLIEALARDYPDSPEIASLGTELDEARRRTVDELRGRLYDARKAGDPDRVIDLRDALTRELRGEPLRDLDRKVVRWLSRVVEERTRAGDVDPRTVALAGRIVDTFGDTPEGARLLEALPGMRRNAGLCGRCERPHRGPGLYCARCRSRSKRGPSAPGSEIEG